MLQLAHFADAVYGHFDLCYLLCFSQNGEYIRQLFPKHCDSSIIKTSDYATCNFSLLHDRQGDCRIIVGDMNAIQAIDPEWVSCVRGESILDFCCYSISYSIV